MADGLDDLPILPRLTRWRQHRPADLHPAVGVGERAVFLGKRAGWQHDVGMERRFGQEQVLHDQMIQLRQRTAGMVQVGVGHGGVLPLHIHAGDRAGMDGVHDLDHREARDGVDRVVPILFEMGADGRILDGLVIRQHHRD